MASIDIDRWVQLSQFLAVSRFGPFIYLTYGGGTIYGMTIKTTVYLPEELKKALEAEARRRGQSEAEVVRNAISALVTRPRPKPGIVEGDPIAADSEELLSGFGER